MLCVKLRREFGTRGFYHDLLLKLHFHPLFPKFTGNRLNIQVPKNASQHQRLDYVYAMAFPGQLRVPIEKGTKASFLIILEVDVTESSLRTVIPR